MKLWNSPSQDVLVAVNGNSQKNSSFSTVKHADVISSCRSPGTTKDWGLWNLWPDQVCSCVLEEHTHRSDLAFSSCEMKEMEAKRKCYCRSEVHSSSRCHRGGENSLRSRTVEIRVAGNPPAAVRDLEEILVSVMEIRQRKENMEEKAPRSTRYFGIELEK